MADAELYHPALDRTATVPAHTVRIWERVGWLPATERPTEPPAVTRRRRTRRRVDRPEIPGAVYAPRVEIAPPSADEPAPEPGADPTTHEED